ncbi:MAG TPA: hypothetical protein VLI04_03000 [Nocardioidaceae bacterium]|nr:hypothetical protein [Nocardioidaceae bacterium]
MNPWVGVLLVGVVVIVGALLLIMTTSRSDSSASAERAELAALRALVAELKDMAYDHRELDSSLAVLFTDRIRSYERQQRELP